MHLKKPYFVYNDDTSYFYPNVPAGNISDTEGVDRFDHISADGTKLSYYVGPRTFREVTFRWISEAKKIDFIAFWNAVRNGSTFRYASDATVRKLGTGTLGDGYILGQDTAGVTITSTYYTAENTELVFTEDEVYGFWTTTIRMREVV
jgi:hypothetical protein